MEISCCFCDKTEEEILLIEISTNSLLIGKTHYEFSNIFQELLGIVEVDSPLLTYICDTCKDSAVNFFIFKKNVEQNKTNPHRNMIFSQIDDFLKQIKSFEEIQVVRKLHSITLQIDQAATTSDFKNPNDDQKEDKNVYEEFLMDVAEEEEEIIEDEVLRESMEDDIDVLASTCPKCGEETPNETKEVHEFLKHSLLGIQIENEAETSEEENSMKKCRTCQLKFDDSTRLTNHFIVEHLEDFLNHVNQAFGFNESFSSLSMISKYLTHIKALICGNMMSKIDEKVKQYFYQTYCVDAARPNEIEEVEDENFIDSSYEETSEVVDFTPSKSSKTSISFSSLDEESREWVRNQIVIRRSQVVNEFGVSREIFRCVYCNVYSSNSSAGFRYHLINKHLKDKSFRDQREVQTDLTVLPAKKKSGRNICTDCNLKFKDQKLLTSHQNCHELFDTISPYYEFPSCHTCNSLYIDDASLNIHLNKHDTNVDVTQPVSVPAGAIVIQGKRATELRSEDEDQILEFSWSCGHCSKKFSKEDQCRFHLLMAHVPFFTCPIDKREFSGYKAVSLFAHHLKNKHPEIFPDVMFPCTFCNLEFTSVYDKLSHMKNCNEKKFECDHCQKKFFRKSDLVSHLKFISGELYFQCKTCNKKCETLSDLKIHFRSHTKEKPFSCAICNKSFRTLAARSTHVESHNQNVTYMCVCGKSFKQRHIYRRHYKATHEHTTKPPAEPNQNWKF